MKITKEWVDQITPEHGRTSCLDENLSNGYGAILPTFDTHTGLHEVRHPRCNRCYLLNNIDCDTDDLDFDLRVTVSLEPKKLLLTKIVQKKGKK